MDEYSHFGFLLPGNPFYSPGVHCNLTSFRSSLDNPSGTLPVLPGYGSYCDSYLIGRGTSHF